MISFQPPAALVPVFIEQFPSQRPADKRSCHVPGQSVAPNLPQRWTQALEYARDAHLGNGSFAQIFKIVAKRTGEQFAMKVMDRRFYAARKMEPQLNCEVEAMRQTTRAGRTDHIVKLLDTFEENGAVFLRMELCGISLESLSLQQPHRQLAEHDVAPWAQQLFCGLQDIHALGIIHRDIKPENLLLGTDGKLKIVDFGWCTWVQNEALMRRSTAGPSLAGTFQFMAPEILEEGPQTEAVDVWSAGASLLELLTGQALITVLRSPTGLSNSDPFRAGKIRAMQVLTEIRQKCPPAPHAKPPNLSSCCWAFCQALLVPQAYARISVPDALCHRWLQRNPSRAPPCAQQQHAITGPSWAPVRPEHLHSGGRSTTASSSSSTPRTAFRSQCQVLNWGDIASMQPQPAWPSAPQYTLAGQQAVGWGA